MSFRAGQRDPGGGVVDYHQRLTLGHARVLTDQDPCDVARHFRADRGDVGFDIGVVGAGVAPTPGISRCAPGDGGQLRRLNTFSTGKVSLAERVLRWWMRREVASTERLLGWPPGKLARARSLGG